MGDGRFDPWTSPLETPIKPKGSWHNSPLEQVLETIKNGNKEKLHKRPEAYAIFQIRSYDFNFAN